MTSEKGRVDDHAGIRQGDSRSTAGGREVGCAGVRPGDCPPPVSVRDRLRVDVNRTEVLKHRPAPVAESAAAPDDASPRTAIIPAADPVIAGVDGSRCARNAAHWAAVEASRRHVALHLVHAYHLPPGGFPGYNPYPPHLLADLRDEGAAILADTVGEVHRQSPDLPIDSALVYGDPATVLRHASATAVADRCR